MAKNPTFDGRTKHIDIRFHFIHELAENGEIICDAPKPGGPLTTRQLAEYRWMSGYPTPL